MSSVPDTVVAVPPERIALVTDFGSSPYTGQLRLAASGRKPQLPVIDLIDDLPSFRPDLAAYLLPALVRGMPGRTLYLTVVDPGVGGMRAALALRCGPNWFVGPDNGLLSVAAGRADGDIAIWRIDWRPAYSSDSFHGRDLFLPIALAVVAGRLPRPCARLDPCMMQGADWPDEMAAVIYVDHYGNLITGLDAGEDGAVRRLRVGRHVVGSARTFCEVAAGEAFWYRNSFGLVEVAVNRGRADQRLGVLPGEPVSWA